MVQLTESDVISLRSTRSLKRILERGFLNSHLSNVDCSLPSLLGISSFSFLRASFFLDDFLLFFGTSSGSTSESITPARRVMRFFKNDSCCDVWVDFIDGYLPIVDVSGDVIMCYSSL